MSGNNDTTEVCELFPEIHPGRVRSVVNQAPGKLAVQFPLRNADAWALYAAVRYLLESRFHQTEIPARRADFTVFKDGQLVQQRLSLAAVYGRLVLEGHTDPHEGRGNTRSGDDLEIAAAEQDPSDDDHSKPDRVLISPRFVTAVVSAFNAYSAQVELYDAVFRMLREEGVPDRADAPKSGGVPYSVVYGRQMVEVADHLVRAGVSVGDPHLRRHVVNALTVVMGGSDESRGSSVPIDLLNLEDDTSATVIPENVRALSFLYQAAILEELKVPQVVDRIIQHWMEGTLPVTLGTGPDLLYKFFRSTQDRLSEVERRSLFARAFGIAQGSVEVELPNREFQDLWIRLLASISAYSRESVDGFAARRSVTKEQVFKSARDLGANLSLHGYGMPHFAAVELQNTYQTLFSLLGNSDILQAYGVRDRWQLVERVSQLYLGGAVNSVKLRTMAQSGGAVLRWIAEQGQVLSGPFPPRDFDTRVLQWNIPQTSSTLASEAERWLAVTGTNEQTVSQFSEPVSLNNQSTVPSLSLASMPDIRQVQQMARNLMPNGAGTIPTA